MSRRRLYFFIFGTVAGCAFVYFILIKGKKFPAWLPKDRIKEQIAGTRVELTPQTTCMLNCLKIDAQEISKVIVDGEIDLSKSETGAKPPVYWIEGKVADGRMVRIFTETNSKTQVTKVVGLDIKEKSQLHSCNCDTIK